MIDKGLVKEDINWKFQFIGKALANGSSKGFDNIYWKLWFDTIIGNWLQILRKVRLVTWQATTKLISSSSLEERIKNNLMKSRLLKPQSEFMSDFQFLFLFSFRKLPGPL